mgnify:CR=1 FL=1
MISIQIGQSQRRWRSLDEVEENWIAQQVNQRQRDGAAVCVTVEIETRDVHVVLYCGDCSPSGRGGRTPTEDERRILELWDKLTQGNSLCEPGTIIAFLKQLRFRL